MLSRRALGLFTFLIATLATFASEPHRVFDPPRLPKEARLQLRWNLDRPAPFTGDFPNKETWEKRAAAVREQILVSQGLWPIPPKCPLNPVVTGKIDRDDYTIENVYFTSWPGHYVTGNLYRPKGKNGKLPAMLSPHGHYANGRLTRTTDREIEQNLKSGAESMKDNAAYPLQARCAMLARMGFVVFFYDMLGYADSLAIPHRAGFNSVECELRQQSSMGLQSWNSIRALDYLTSLPEVDLERVAMTGSSGGGTQTFILAAFDPRVKLAAPAVMVSMNMQGGCICENSSHLRVGTNNVELAALFAPKPMLMPSAHDWTRDIVQHGLPELRKIYRLYGAEDKVDGKVFPYPHGYHQPMREYLYHFLNVHFHLGLAEPIKEKPFVPVPPEELRVFGKDHPHPADELNAAKLGEAMAQASDAQLAELAKNPDEYRKIVRTALRVLIHDEPPHIGETVAKQVDFVDHSTYYVWKGTQSRKNEQEEIPTIAVVPKDNNGTAIVWVHPRGKASLFDEKGELIPAVQDLLKAKYAIVAPDVFLTGEYHLGDKHTAVPWFPQPHHKDIPFAGFVFGYNRSVFAERVRDILTVITHLHTRKDVKRVHLVGFGSLGPCALVARVMAGKLVEQSLIEGDRFDLNRGTEYQDERLLPGFWKYQGIVGCLTLCTTGQTTLFLCPSNPLEKFSQSLSRMQSLNFKSEKLLPEMVIRSLK